MKNPLDQWLASCSRAPGMLGGGVQMPDQSFFSHSFHETFPPAHIAETLRCLVEFSPVLAAQGFFPRWFTLNFEQGRLRVAMRPDGALLALAIRSDPGAVENLDLLTEEFFKLQLSN